MRAADLLRLEARAQAWIFAASGGAVAAAALLPARDVAGLVVATYYYGAVFLGAQSVGYDYSHRTLTMSLAQPVRRQQQFFSKMAVLAAMVLFLLAVAAASLAARRVSSDLPITTLLWLPLLPSLLMAPLMTMVARSVLGGAFLSLFVAGLLWMSLVAGFAWTSGAGIDDAGERALHVVPWALAALCALTGVLGWRRFLRLEALEGDVAQVSLPSLSAAAAGRDHRPWRALVGKELHLQQMTLAITAYYVVMWAAMAWLRRAVPSWSSFPLGAITLVYCMILPAVVGATASAEERRMGMHDWQRLQPVPMWQQWLIKVATTFSLAVVFGIGLPIVLAVASGDVGPPGLGWNLAQACLFLTAASLYLSSLASSAVRAMVFGLPAAIGFGWFTHLLAVLLDPNNLTPGWLTIFATPLFAPALSVLLLWFGFVNHASTDAPPKRVALQALAIAALAAAAMAAGRL